MKFETLSGKMFENEPEIKEACLVAFNDGYQKCQEETQKAVKKLQEEITFKIETLKSFQHHLSENANKVNAASMLEREEHFYRKGRIDALLETMKKIKEILGEELAG